MPAITQSPPDFSENAVGSYLSELYDLKVSVKPLVSDIGQNFLLTDAGNMRYVFKIANPDEDKYMLEAQNLTIQTLNSNEKEFEYPEIIPSIEGEQIVKLQAGDNIFFNARLLTFLEGKFYSELEQHTPEMLNSMGHMLGKIDKTLKAVSHPALDRYWHWDLKNTSDLRQHLHCIKDARKRHMAEYRIMQFETNVMPQFPQLRKSVIHNDANDNNVLVNSSGQVSGIIDFGDMVHSYTIFELGVCLAYVMMEKNDPLVAAAQVVKGYHGEYPLDDIELEVLFDCICARLTNSVVMAALQQQERPDNEYLSVSENPAWELLEKLLAISPQKALKEFRKACGLVPHRKAGKNKEEILALRNEKLGKSLSVSYNKPLKITRGAGQYLFEENGDTYLDCVNNVCHVGHCHPKVVKAAQTQIATLNTNTRYLHDNIVKYAERLTALFPDPLNVCFLVNSGSEANELAYRLAKTYTGQDDFIVLDHAYHGNTSACVELSPYKHEGPGGKGAAPFIHKTEIPDVYRGKYKADNPQAAELYADCVKEAVSKIAGAGKGIAGFFSESVPGVAGQVFLPDGYLEKAFQHVRVAGGLCIADEVQIGFGRIGSHFWGFETQNVVPDIVTMGKPIGNGHPLGAVVTTKEIADAFDNGMEYFNTFGGNPVSCAIGLAVLDVLQEENLQQNSLEVGNYFKERLMQLKPKYELIGDVRGMGLFIGVELVTDHQTLEPAVRETAHIVNEMKNRHILLSIDGPLHNIIKIKPPIVFNKNNADWVVDELDNVLKNM